MAKPKWVWIGREKDEGVSIVEHSYVVCPFQECRLERHSDRHGINFRGDPESLRLCPKAVHRVLGIRLKPGEGPVRVKFTAELVRD